MNGEFDREKLIRSQPVPSDELNRRLLERAEKLTEGRKLIGTDKDNDGIKPVITIERNDDKMDKHTQIAEVRSHRPAAIIAAAAALALVIGGTAAALKYSRGDIEPSPASQTETSAASSDKVGENTVASDAQPKEWAEKYVAENEQCCGFITIPNLEYDDGTRAIDFPVVIADDNNYYMTHSFDKSENESGCIFADAETEIGSDGSQPQIIQLYGSATFYNFGWLSGESKWQLTLDGEGDTKTPNFTALQLYTTIEALKQAPFVEFNTIWQEGGEYAVIGVTEVQGDALGIGEVDDIPEWVGTIRDLSDFDVDIDCGADDKYLVLNLHDGLRTQFRVFAKKLDESDNKEQIKSSYRLKESAENNYSADGNYVEIDLPMPKDVSGIMLLEVYNGDSELSADTFADEERKIFDSSFTIDEKKQMPEKIRFSVPGEGKQKVTVAFIDPLSSDSTRNRVKYSVLDVDFDNGTYTVVGDINYDGVKKMFGKYKKTQSMYIPVYLPEETKNLYFEAYLDDKLYASEFVESVEQFDDPLPQLKFIIDGTGKRKVTIYVKKGSNKEIELVYAVYDVDFDNGTYKYAEGGKPKNEELLKLTSE